MEGKSYNTGKKNEKQSWARLQKLGFIRPTSQQRKNVVEAYARQGKEIKPKGYDLIKLPNEKALDDVDKLSKTLEKVVLYELKTAGKNRRQPLKENWSGLGFTLTGAEKHNAELLGQQYKFLFLNLKTNKFHICQLEDFFSPEVSGIYPTWSIFIKKSLTN